VLPLALFRDRIFAVACAHGVLAGWAMFGSVAFVPLFVQAVLGTSATAAGATLTPLMLGWVTSSVIGSRLLLQVGYRTLALIGMLLLTVGTFLLTRIGVDSSQLSLLIALGMMGTGMGLSIPAFLIAVQSMVPRHVLGTATSTLTFSRSIGGVLGVSVMGALLSIRLATSLATAGLDPATVTLDSLLDPLARSSSSVAIEGALRGALAVAIQGVFVTALVAAVLGLAATALAPSGQIAQLAAQRSQADKEAAGRSATTAD
jgi:hypothetical protein